MKVAVPVPLLYAAAMPHPVLIYSTAPSPDVASQLARGLVEARLAACVNMLPGMCSVYRFEGKLEEADEIALLIKTMSDKTDAVKAFLGDEHPYDTPCCVVLKIEDGLPEFLAWIVAETR